MVLRWGPTSPFARKCLAVAIKAGLEKNIEVVQTNAADPGLLPDNPLGKIPALVGRDGVKLDDSPLICEYLDSLHKKTKLIPRAGKKRWAALQQQALADGIMDAAVACVAERNRPPGEQSQAFIAKQKGKMERAIAVLDADVKALGGAPTVGSIAVACALDYCSFRHPDFGWRSKARKLAQWLDGFAKQPFMKATEPRLPT